MNDSRNAKPSGGSRTMTPVALPLPAGSLAQGAGPPCIAEAKKPKRFSGIISIMLWKPGAPPPCSIVAAPFSVPVKNGSANPCEISALRWLSVCSSRKVSRLMSAGWPSSPSKMCAFM